MTTEAERITELERERDMYRTLHSHALDCVDRVFQKCSEIPNPLLPDFLQCGEDKFRGVVKLAEAYKSLLAQLKGTGHVPYLERMNELANRAELAEARNAKLREACEVARRELNCIIGQAVYRGETAGGPKRVVTKLTAALAGRVNVSERIRETLAAKVREIDLYHPANMAGNTMAINGFYYGRNAALLAAAALITASPELAEQSAELTALRAENERLRQDSARLNWLESTRAEISYDAQAPDNKWSAGAGWYGTLREAIDAAIASQETKIAPGAGAPRAS